MATVTVDPVETPSQAIVNAAAAVTPATDAQGRRIGVRKLLALDRMRLFEVVGPENSKNEQYLGYASLAFHVGSIDGEAVPRPATKAQLEALVQRLGDDGFAAVGAAVAALYPPAEDPEQTLKNASGTPTSCPACTWSRAGCRSTWRSPCPPTRRPPGASSWANSTGTSGT